ncbi:MAG TPA: aminotransferase class IV [Polyangiaceae bacterium]|jgi:branched-chain amino acid aminotransferase
MRNVWINGVRHGEETAVISVFDRGFLYGDSVFEALRTYGGRPFALDAHMDRLARSAARVLIAMPLELPAFAAEVERAVAVPGESYVRIMLTRGTGPLNLDPDTASRPNRVIIVEPLATPPAELYERGIGVVFFRTIRATDGNPGAGAKVANYLTSLLALRDAKTRGASEALVVDASGHVLEGTTSNFFIVRGRKLITPPEESGILAGITRVHVLAVAPSIGLEVEVANLTERDVLEADEVFVCSSIREIVPVIRVESTVIGDGQPGATTRALHEAFRRVTRGAAH